MCSARTWPATKLHAYHELEPELERDGKLSYREVMTEAMRRLGAPAGEEDGLADVASDLATVPGSPHERSQELRDRGWRLGDPDELRPRPDRGVEGAARRAHSTRPSLQARSARTSRRSSTGASSRDLACYDPARYVHVAQSHFHDIVPATELGIPNVWINRLGERPRARRRHAS